MNSFEHAQIRNYRDRWGKPVKPSPSMRKVALTLGAIAGVLSVGAWKVQDTVLTEDQPRSLATVKASNSFSEVSETENLVHAVLSGMALAETELRKEGSVEESQPN